MTYELAKKLKDAGWPQDHDCIDGKKIGDAMMTITLEFMDQREVTKFVSDIVKLENYLIENA